MKLAEFRRFYRRHAVVFRTNVRAGCQYQPSGPIPKFLLLKAEDSELSMRGPARSWVEISTEMLLQTIPGNHFTILQSPGVEAVARHITRYFADAATEATREIG